MIQLFDLRTGVLLVTALLVTANVHGAERPSSDEGTWSQWRGPARDGQFQGPTWPDAISDGRLTPRWRVEGLGPSYCGPIVSETLIFTAETRDKRQEVVQAYDRETGAPVWEVSWPGAMTVPFFAAKNGSWMRATPAFDGERLYVAGMRDVLVCLEGATGEELWRVDFVSKYDAAPPDFGFVSSPLVTDEHVYVQAGGSFCKLDKRTGEAVWRSLHDGGGMMGSAFSSPFLGAVAGREQLLVLGRSHMNGVDPDDGAVLWSTPIKSFRGMNILTPVVHEGAVFTAPYGGRAQMLDVTAGDEAHEVATRWNNRIQGYMTSPVVIDGHAYFFTRSNRFTCVRLSDGEITWISPPTGDNYWSLVAQGDRILALNDTGRLRLIRANPEEYQVIDEVRVAETQTWAHLAIAGRQVVIREQNALAVLDWN